METINNADGTEEDEQRGIDLMQNLVRNFEVEGLQREELRRAIVSLHFDSQGRSKKILGGRDEEFIRLQAEIREKSRAGLIQRRRSVP